MTQKEKAIQKTQANPRTYLISSTQLVTLMKYLMNQKYGEVKIIMDMLSTLKQLDSRVGPEFVSDKGEDDGGKK
jgi:hypothetical protein|tara:strand:+ start:81 stop:302 length:222 start_codon:yes stop_codon:yes gene_type:complete